MGELPLESVSFVTLLPYVETEAGVKSLKYFETVYALKCRRYKTSFPVDVLSFTMPTPGRASGAFMLTDALGSEREAVITGTLSYKDASIE